MSSFNFRRPLFAAAVALLGLTTACSDSTGPDMGARRRSGYLTASSAVQVAPTSGTTSTGPTSGTPTGTTSVGGVLPVKPKGVETQNSGYNVTAF
jgi:hypothetical protein